MLLKGWAVPSNFYGSDSGAPERFWWNFSIAPAATWDEEQRAP
jgi:hypothetical protein